MSIMPLYEKSFINNLEGIRHFHRKVTLKMIWSETLQDIISSLHALNVKSYNLRYDEELDTVLHYPNNMNQIKNVHNECSLLKALKCLNYNIDMKELKKADLVNNEEERSYKFLVNFIDELKDYIIDNNELYKSAAWE